MASVTTGNQASERNQTTAMATMPAVANCARKSRVRVAKANAAMPRGVKGCHASLGVNGLSVCFFGELNARRVCSPGGTVNQECAQVENVALLNFCTLAIRTR